MFVGPSLRDKQQKSIVLKELNQYLLTRSYLVRNEMTLADLAIFYTIQDIMGTLSTLDKENFLNLSRWYNHLQQHKLIRQGGGVVNFSTIHLL